MKQKPGKIEQQASQLYVSYGYGLTPWQKLRKKYRDFFIRLAWMIHRRLAAAERRGYKRGFEAGKVYVACQAEKGGFHQQDPIVPGQPSCLWCEYDEAEGFLIARCPKCAAKAEKGGGK